MMTFEYVIVCSTNTSASVHALLSELLAEALEDSADEFDDDEVSRMINVKHERVGHSCVCTSGACNCDMLVGFALELPAIDAADAVVDQFTDSLPKSARVRHAVKFEDPLLQDDLAHWATEIFMLEMKLRRVLSFIYLNAYEYRDPYKLLKNDKVKPMTQDLEEEDMAILSENQFFHLNFRQYISLNDRSKLQMADMVRMIRDSEDYEWFRQEVTRPPVKRSGDMDLLNDLKALMDPIEKMRNCVAHNRTPSAIVRQSYLATHRQVEDRLDRYLDELVGA